MKHGFTIVLLLLAKAFTAQEAFTEFQVWPVGDKQQFEQVLQTQLDLPEVLLTKHFSATIKVNFDIDSQGVARHLIVEGTKNNALRDEIARIMRFYRFKPSRIPFVREQPYFVVFELSTKAYEGYLKQRSRARIKNPAVCDTSMHVLTRADRSPAYYRNSDEGLADYILSEISYPDLAIEKSVEGTVLLEFIVETNGFVTDLHVKNPVGAGCSEEAVRLIRATRWQPAELDGKAVRYKMRYPITFSLRTSGNSGFQPATTVGN
jgi:protein TonB